MKVYWSRCGYGDGNFGDRLTPLLLEHFHVRCEWASPEHAQLVGVGSVLEKVPERFRGIIWTSGLMHASSRKSLPHARVLAVRGRLTRDRMDCADKERVGLGDGGLLSHLVYRPAGKRFRLGLVPHFVDAGDPVVQAIHAAHPEITVIDVCRPPRDVIQAIGACEHVLSSSLHGLVVADSLGIPNRWMELNRGAETVQGAGFKFRDYHSNFGIDDATPYSPTAVDTLDTLLPLFAEYRRPGLDALQRGLQASLETLAAEAVQADTNSEAHRESERQAWIARWVPAREQLAAIIPAGAHFLFIDEDQLRADLPSGWARPFLEKNGQYWGPPSDDATAIRELERMRREGAAYLVVAWPAFWWLEYYAQFERHLRTQYQCVCRSEHLIIFKL